MHCNDTLLCDVFDTDHDTLWCDIFDTDHDTLSYDVFDTDLLKSGRSLGKKDKKRYTRTVAIQDVRRQSVKGRRPAVKGVNLIVPC